MLGPGVGDLTVGDDAGDRELAAEIDRTGIAWLELELRPLHRQGPFSRSEAKQRPGLLPAMLNPDRLPVLKIRGATNNKLRLFLRIWHFRTPMLAPRAGQTRDERLYSLLLADRPWPPYHTAGATALTSA